VAYATEERESEEKTANATTFDERSPIAWIEAKGMPTSHRLINTVPTTTPEGIVPHAEGPSPAVEGPADDRAARASYLPHGRRPAV
jgi:hypothetical protein